ncbi:hypothetical protein HRM2_30490 [Desulforapulum autotrophicum HRM2]|uniref:Uncharacterized protein n=1 Tax=Desulforapulum autotrophicum (strain ATCC 43914 / DSM 3382 / VKM B-1955 / HRM2) TaxID=177437 RepID=C0QKP2_DESAH|nr:hypothetical protein [Desulforapulum autotrophicum]ACN16132.1 hypothetical protein HRM2_30490 [Desulforapulum autotrophicum HRM2]
MINPSKKIEQELKPHSRLVPVRKKNKAAFYLIDDSGKVDPVPWVRRLLVVLVCLTLGLTATTASLVWYFIAGQGSRTDLVQQLHVQELTIQGLANDKEILMARLVLSGNAADLDSGADREAAPSEKKSIEPQLKSTHGPSKLDQTTQIPPGASIAIEDIRVSNDGKNGDLLVRFNIKNISSDLDAVAGYVFVALKPGTSIDSNWLVLPSVGIDKGKPTLYKKGRYFSIAHFKPINFRVKSTLSPDAFNSATVFVYDDQGDLIFMQDIMLAETEG